MKKFLKVCSIIVIAILLFVIGFFLYCFISLRMTQKSTREQLAADGLYNPVSAGDVELNMPVFGSSDAPYTVVALPGRHDALFAAQIKAFSESAGDDCRFVIADRPGYGVSEVSKQEITPEYAVECARTALQNAGIQKPYVLMPHSLGGLYATYWESTYPDEIAGVLFLDTVTPADADVLQNTAQSDDDKQMAWMCKTGLMRIFVGNYKSVDARLLPEQLQEDAALLQNYNFYNDSLASEDAHLGDSAKTVLNAVKTNEIPKIYISTDCSTDAEYEEAVRFRFGVPEGEEPEELAEWIADMKAAAYDDAAKQERTAFLEQLGNCEQVNIPGIHAIYMQKPEAVAEQLHRLFGQIG